MQLATASINGAFSATIPGLQLIWDSTSMGLLKECPRKYYYQMVLGYNTRLVNIHLLFGSLYHACLEEYDHDIASGLTHRQALLKTARKALLESGTYRKVLPPCPDCEHTAWEPAWDSDTKVVCKVCGRIESFWEIEPTFFPWAEDDYKNRITLVRSVVWYLDQFKNDDVKTYILQNGKPAVELSFKIDTQLVAPDGEHYALSGHLDKLGSAANTLYVVDRKTTKSTIGSYFFKKFSPDNQMSYYIFAAKTAFEERVQGAIIDGAQIMMDATRFSRGTVTRTSAQIEEWWEDILIQIKHNEEYVANKHWPMNDKSCDKYGGCPFIDVCSKDPQIRETYLKDDFVQRVWDPSISRGVSD